MEASAARRPTRPGPRVPAKLLRLASDERLVDLVRAGSEPAFECVYDRHHRGILAFCRHLLGSPEEAEDAVQHTFLAAYRELARTQKRIHLRPWLYTIARNRCLTVLRARRERSLEDADEPATEHLSAVVQRRQDLRDLLRDLHELPEDQRAALVLAEAGDVSHEEIAEILGVPREKVKALVFQARSSLIASRQARDTSCDTIQRQLVELKGGALRRNTLRRHLKECAGCREFRAALQAQRRLLAIALPVVPSIALKQAVLGGTVGSGTMAAAGGGAAAVAGGTLAGTGASLTAKALVVAAVAGGGGATIAGVESVVSDPAPRQAAPAPDVRPAERDPVPVPAPGGSHPQEPEAAVTRQGAGTPAAARRRERAENEAPAESARPDAPPGLVEEEAASVRPEAPPGQVKAKPAKPVNAPADVVKENIAGERTPVTPGRPAEPPAKKPESAPDSGRVKPDAGRPAEEIAPALAPVPAAPDGTVEAPLPERAPAPADAGKDRAAGRAHVRA